MGPGGMLTNFAWPRARRRTRPRSRTGLGLNFQFPGLLQQTRQGSQWTVPRLILLVGAVLRLRSMHARSPPTTDAPGRAVAGSGDARGYRRGLTCVRERAPEAPAQSFADLGRQQLESKRPSSKLGRRALSNLLKSPWPRSRQLELGYAPSWNQNPQHQASLLPQSPQTGRAILVASGAPFSKPIDDGQTQRSIEIHMQYYKHN